MPKYARLSIDKIEQIIQVYTSGISSKNIAKKFGIDPATVRNHLKRQNQKIRKQGTQYVFNQNYFQQIDSEEKAYWLGFLLADGCVIQNRLCLELCIKDILHLEKFKKAIQANHPIKKSRKNCARIEVSSSILLCECEQFGLINKKTKTCKFPQIPHNFERHCMRGIFEGDGWFVRRNPTKTRRAYWEMGFSSGSKEMISFIHSWCKNQIGKECGYLIERNRENGSVYQLTFGGNKIVNKLVTIIYDESTIYLERKFQQYKNCLLETL